MTEGEERDEAFNRSAPLMLLILVFAIAASYFLFLNPTSLQGTGKETTTTRTLRQATPEPVIVPARTYSEGGKTQTGEKQTTTKPAPASGETSTQPQEQTYGTTAQAGGTTENTEESELTSGKETQTTGATESTLTEDEEYKQYANDIESAASQSQFYNYYYSQQENENGGFDYES